MQKKTLQEKLTDISHLAELAADRLGLLLVEAKFGQSGRTQTLQVTIFRKGGAVSHDDCQQMSRSLSAILEEEAPAKGLVLESSFLIEVQSPGLDRELKTERDFELFAGQQIEIRTKQKINDLGDYFTAVLIGRKNGCLKIAHAQSIGKQKNGQVKEYADLAIEQNKIARICLHAAELKPKN